MHHDHDAAAEPDDCLGRGCDADDQATGTTPLTYQWYLGTRSDESNAIAGATAGSYTTPPLTTDTQYWARVSNDCGVVDSATAIVKVPTIVVIGHNNGVGEPSTDGFAPLTVVWEGIAEPSADDSFDLYAVGAPNGRPLASWRTGGTAEDSYIVFLMSDFPTGRYELRLKAQNGHLLAVSNPFNITGPAPSLAVSPQSVLSGGTLAVTWHGIATPSSMDGFGLVPYGKNSDSYLTWQDTAASASGSAFMDVPSSLSPGLYVKCDWLPMKAIKV